MALKPSARDNFVYLTAALLAALFLVAIMEQFTATFGGRLVKGLLLLALTGALWSVRQQTGAFRSGLVVLGGFLILELASYWLDLTELRLLQLAILFLYFGSMAWLAVKQVLFLPGAIDANRLLGAISVYLLIGLQWAVIYLAILEIEPAAFNGTEPGSWSQIFHEIVYFSFVSLTTLGYGDISPAIPITRFLVYLEAIVGQLYLAIMIASLVGIGISNRTSIGDSPQQPPSGE